MISWSRDQGRCRETLGEPSCPPMDSGGDDSTLVQRRLLRSKRSPLNSSILTPPPPACWFITMWKPLLGWLQAYVERARLEMRAGNYREAREILSKAASLPNEEGHVYNMWATLELREVRPVGSSLSDEGWKRWGDARLACPWCSWCSC